MDAHTFLHTYRLPLTIEEVEQGTYLATSPALQGLLVQANSIEELLTLVPGVAKALLQAMQEKGISPRIDRQELSFPISVEVLIV